MYIFTWKTVSISIKFETFLFDQYSENPRSQPCRSNEEFKVLNHTKNLLLKNQLENVCFGSFFIDC